MPAGFCLLTGRQMGASREPDGSQRGATWELLSITNLLNMKSP